MADSDGADYSRELEHATLAAREAGAVALEHYGKVERLTKTHAATTDEPVTVADRAAQRAVLDRLRRHFPDYGVIGEESETGESITAENLRPDGRNWVIDPIDGTNNFIAGLGNWAVCVGLLDAGRPVVGVVYDVTRDLMYGGVVGGGATINGREAVVKDEPMSPTSVFMLTSNLVNTGPAPAWASRLFDQTDWKVRMLGTAALECAMVGAGIADAAITVNGKLWDVAAAGAFTLAAGGRVTKLDGSPLFPYDVAGYRGAKVPFLAASPAAHAGVVRHLSSSA